MKKLFHVMLKVNDNKKRNECTNIGKFKTDEKIVIIIVIF